MAVSAHTTWRANNAYLLFAGLILLATQIEISLSFSSPRISMMVASSSRPRSKNKKRSSSTLSKISKKGKLSNTAPKKIKLSNEQQNKKTKKEPSSVGEAIQLAQSVEELFEAASKLWLPTDENLLPHLLTQQVHHEKRQRWSSMLLQKLGCVVSYSEQQFDPEIVWNDDRLARAVLAAALRFKEETPDRPDKEGRYLCQALEGLHGLAGIIPPPESLHSSILQGLQILLERSNNVAPHLSLRQLAEVRWTANGVVARIPSLSTCNLDLMQNRVDLLPFDILPLGLDWARFAEDQKESDTWKVDSIVGTLRDAIPFNFDVIVTRTGSSVTERRGTAWVAKEDVGALAYSGKLMTPSPLPNVVSEVMQAVETAVDVPLGFFDCALCNHYPTRVSACKFHTDPEHGTMWDPLTCVVAAGDHRRFAFRPIPGHTNWDKWESDSSQKNSKTQDDESNAPAVVRLFPGDIVQMWGTCNDDFHHAVYVSEDDQRDDDVVGDGRVSLVLKRAIDRGGGRKGHGLQGSGRRSRRKRQ